MKFQYAIFPLSLIAVIPIFFVSAALGVIYLMLWIDKIVLRTITPAIAGIELVTISTILLGIKFGLAGAVLALVFMPLFEGIKILFIPAQSDVPPFTPSPYHAIDFIAALIASSLKSLPLLQIVAVVMIMKFLAVAFIDMYIVGKPFGAILVITSFAFNVLLVIYASGFLSTIVAL